MSQAARERLIADRYAMDSILRQGRAGVVWRATDVVDGTAVAVEQHVQQPDHTGMLQRGRHLGSLNDPGPALIALGLGFGFWLDLLDRDRNAVDHVGGAPDDTGPALAQDRVHGVAVGDEPFTGSLRHDGDSTVRPGGSPPQTPAEQE